MPVPSPAVPGVVAVVVHGPASSPLPQILWAVGLRPVAGTDGPTIWLPADKAVRDGGEGS